MTVISVFFDVANPKSFESERLNPDLHSIWFSRFGIRIGKQCKSLFLDHTTTVGAQFV